MSLSNGSSNKNGEIWTKKRRFFDHENVFENVDSKISSILFRRQNDTSDSSDILYWLLNQLTPPIRETYIFHKSTLLIMSPPHRRTSKCILGFLPLMNISCLGIFWLVLALSWMTYVLRGRRNFVWLIHVVLNKYTQEISCINNMFA